MRKSALQSDEFKEFYGTYLSTLGDDVELMETLIGGKDSFVQFIESIPKEKLAYVYLENKWTVAEVLEHIIDTERVFQYRAFRFSRNDKTPLPGFEQDDYVLQSNANKRSKEDLLNEYLNVRKASISLFNYLDREKLLRTGTASGIQWSVAGLGFVICGHQEHHRRILEERYLK